MHGIRPLSLITAVIALAIGGCQEAPTSPAAEEAAPSVSYLNGPANPGNSGVIRFQDAFGFITFEEAADGLMAFHYETSDLEICGGGGGEPSDAFQIVQNPAGMLRAVINVDGPILIFNAADVFPIFAPEFPVEEACRILQEDWIYRGNHKLHVVGMPGAGPSFGWNGRGDVLDQSGVSYRYTERATYVAAGEGFEEKFLEIEVRPKGRK